MGQFFYEQSGKEKVKGLLEEGQRSQAFYRSGASELSLLHSLQQLILRFLGRRSNKQGHSMQSPKTDFHPIPTNQGE
jgi:hypothetical protein